MELDSSELSNLGRFFGWTNYYTILVGKKHELALLPIHCDLIETGFQLYIVFHLLLGHTHILSPFLSSLFRLAYSLLFDQSLPHDFNFYQMLSRRL